MVSKQQCICMSSCTLKYVSVFISSKDNMPTWRIVFNKLLLRYGKVLTCFISKYKKVKEMEEKRIKKRKKDV
ncbi:hypothetical protein BD560DRAFT_418162 [Blakeslea trispora]|nr:hypothetical protein BD560DRAFT_418162 [Blakeslea trispora]